MDLGEAGCTCAEMIDFSSEWNPVTGLYEHCEAPLGSRKGEELLLPDK
jgi:hypothetical protein